MNYWNTRTAADRQNLLFSNPVPVNLAITFTNLLSLTGIDIQSQSSFIPRRSDLGERRISDKSGSG